MAPALDKDASYNSYGHSIAVNPWGEVIEELDYSEELKIVEIDLDEIKRVREEIPVLKNRRVDLYEIKDCISFDQFPHTIHIENVCSLVLKGN